MIAIVTGGRDYVLTDADREWLSQMWAEYGFLLVLHGDCSGADRQVDRWAWDAGLCSAAVPARWDEWQREHGSPHGAGPDRNRRMADACRGLPAVLLAFPGGRGTASMKREARRCGIEVVER